MATLAAATRVLPQQRRFRSSSSSTSSNGRRAVAAAAAANESNETFSRAVQFRPCIDIHQGRVKQIVGATLKVGLHSTPGCQVGYMDHTARHHWRLRAYALLGLSLPVVSDWFRGPYGCQRLVF
jgi:hypothetical protein